MKRNRGPVRGKCVRMRAQRIADASATKLGIESGVRGSDPARLHRTMVTAARGTQSR